VGSNAPQPSRAASAATSLAPVAAGAAAAEAGPAAPARHARAHEVLRQVIAQRGLRGLWSGFAVSCTQFIPSACLWWGSLPLFRRWLEPGVSAGHALLQGALGGERSDGALWHPPHDEAFGAHPHPPARAPPEWSLAALTPSPQRIVEVLAGGAASGAVAVALCPMDIVRTRAQVEGTPALAVLRALLAEEGARGLWKGCTTRVAMLVPQGMLSSGLYELVKRLSRKEGLGEGGKRVG